MKELKPHKGDPKEERMKHIKYKLYPLKSTQVSIYKNQDEDVEEWAVNREVPYSIAQRCLCVREERVC